MKFASSILVVFVGFNNLPVNGDIASILKAKANRVKSWLKDANKFQYDVDCNWLQPDERVIRVAEGRCPPAQSEATTKPPLSTTKKSLLPPWLLERLNRRKKTKPVLSIRTKQALMSAFSLGGMKSVELDLNENHESHELLTGVSLSLTCNEEVRKAWINYVKGADGGWNSELVLDCMKLCDSNRQLFLDREKWLYSGYSIKTDEANDIVFFDSVLHHYIVDVFCIHILQTDTAVTWYINNNMVQNRKLEWRVTVSSEGILNIWPLLEEDEGNYECAVEGNIMGSGIIQVISKSESVVNGLYNYAYVAIFYLPLAVYAIILISRDLVKPPVKSKREDRMTAFLEEYVLKNGVDVKENIAKAVYGDQFEERKAEITKTLTVGVGPNGEKLRGNHETVMTILGVPKSQKKSTLELWYGNPQRQNANFKPHVLFH